MSDKLLTLEQLLSLDLDGQIEAYMYGYRLIGTYMEDLQYGVRPPPPIKPPPPTIKPPPTILKTGRVCFTSKTQPMKVTVFLDSTIGGARMLIDPSGKPLVTPFCANIPEGKIRIQMCQARQTRGEIWCPQGYIYPQSGKTISVESTTLLL